MTLKIIFAEDLIILLSDSHPKIRRLSSALWETYISVDSFGNNFSLNNK